MKAWLFILIIPFVFTTCSKVEKDTQNACNSSNPLEDVTWLKTIKNTLTNCSCELSIIQGTYNNKTVYFVALTDALCDGISMPTLYDCNGKVVRVFNETDYQDFYNLVTRDKVLYRCKNQ